MSLMALTVFKTPSQPSQNWVWKQVMSAPLMLKTWLLQPGMLQL